MDEPFAALDALTRREMQEELLGLWEQFRFTVLFVTHSIEEAIIVGSRILVLSPHPGRVRAELDASQFRFDEIDSPEFGALSKRIHGLLFGPSSKPSREARDHVRRLPVRAPRPEFEREPVDASDIGDVERPLAFGEKLVNNDAVRRLAILLVLG